MTYASETQSLLDQRVQTTGWQIARTVVLGLLAACLSLFGQACLARARPLFPMIDQNFTAWQSGYSFALLVIGVVWVAAMLQKVNQFQDCLQNLRMQRRLDAQYAVRAQKAAEARRAREDATAAAQSAEAPPARYDKNARSNKFNY
jgi:ABC-type multidrug transport system fused ATPase/permease subunit